MPDRAEPRDTVQGGLLEGHVLGDDEEEERPPRRAVWPLLLAAGLGVLAGVLGDRLADRPAPPAPPALQLQVSLGAGANGRETDRGLAVIGVPIVIRNDGPQPLTLTAIRITGPGAGYRAEVGGGPGADLPRILTPREEVDLRFGITSDCGVGLRPEPAVTLVVRDPAGVTREWPAHIPDLGALWGQTLGPNGCS